MKVERSPGLVPILRVLFLFLRQHCVFLVLLYHHVFLVLVYISCVLVIVVFFVLMLTCCCVFLICSWWAGRHTRGPVMLCEVDRSYIEDGFNLYGLRHHFANFQGCLDIILDRTGE